MKAKKVRTFLNESQNVPEDIIDLVLDIGDIINEYANTDYPVKNIHYDKDFDSYIGKLEDIGNIITMDDMSEIRSRIDKNFPKYADDITFDFKNQDFTIIVEI